jgi:hypothetical protein
MRFCALESAHRNPGIISLEKITPTELYPATKLVVSKKIRYHEEKRSFRWFPLVSNSY